MIVRQLGPSLIAVYFVTSLNISMPDINRVNKLKYLLQIYISLMWKCVGVFFRKYGSLTGAWNDNDEMDTSLVTAAITNPRTYNDIDAAMSIFLT